MSSWAELYSAPPKRKLGQSTNPGCHGWRCMAGEENAQKVRDFAGDPRCGHTRPVRAGWCTRFVVACRAMECLHILDGHGYISRAYFALASASNRRELRLN